MKIGFLFGAGAERSYGLPSGGRFIKDTMLTKRSKLYDELKEFYDGRYSDAYVKKYDKRFLFTKDSTTFRDIVYGAAKRLNEKCNSINSLSDREKELVDEAVPQSREDFKIDLTDAYDAIIKDNDSAKLETNNEYKNLINEFRYYGAVEKDFSTIINPHDAGIIRFWRLVNYFWSAYFSILLPLLGDGEHSKKLEDNSYSYVLKNFEEVTKYIYSEKYLKEKKTKDRHECYYERFREEFDVYCALTTNYTPLVHKLNIPCKNRYVFLSGELALFEVPYELRLVDIRENKIKKADLIFPFLYTQAPIKPIIEPRIIKEYAKALKYLNEIDCLVVVGYSLGTNDNHINAFLRDFVTKQNKRFIYCDYKKGNFNPAETTTQIRESLRIQEKNTPNLVAVENNGDPVELSKRIKKALEKGC